MSARNWTRFVLVAGAALACAVPARAFHEKGVANCDGCHILHNSQGGLPVVPGGAGEWLLKFSQPTDLCLSCHASANGAVLGGDPLHPPPEKGAGNFVFLREDNIGDQRGGNPAIIPGDQAGHNVVSPAQGIAADPAHSAAPGGSYPSTDLSCTSCHDPHGNSNYRMLYSTGAELANGFVFTAPAPLAEGIALNSEESRTNHTAYQDGWSEWCGNCHGSQPHRNLMSFEHPLADEVGEMVDNYNSYDGPAAPTGGNYATAYIPELPVEDPQMTTTATRGASSSSRITCLTCHRAHATSAPRALRWDGNVLRLREDGVVSGSYRIPDPYNDPEQRALCIKCHYQDARQHGMGQPCLTCHRESGKKAP